MTIYCVEYVRPGEKPAMHELEATSDAAARLRFLNLSWVAFTNITVKSIGVKSGQGASAGERKGPGVAKHAFTSPDGGGNCRQCGKPRSHRAHAGQEAITNDAPDRTNAAGKAASRAVRAAAAGIELPGAGHVLEAAQAEIAAATPASLSAEIDKLKNARGLAYGRNDLRSAGAITERINMLKRQRHELESKQ